MREALNSFIAGIPSSGIRKFFDIVSEMNDPEVISLGVGEPDFDTPWHIIILRKKVVMKVKLSPYILL